MQAEFIRKPRRMRLVYQVTAFQVLDTPLGPISLVPGDFILEPCDTPGSDEQFAVRARDLVREYLPINGPANAEFDALFDAQTKARYQADLAALEKDMAAVMGSGLPLVEKPTPGRGCSFEMIQTGAQAIPRSCPTCGVFGKCWNGLDDPIKERLQPREAERVAAAQRIAQEQEQTDAGHGRGGTLPVHPEDGEPTLRLVGEDLTALEPTHFIVGGDGEEDGPLSKFRQDLLDHGVEGQYISRDPVDDWQGEPNDAA